MILADIRERGKGVLARAKGALEAVRARGEAALAKVPKEAVLLAILLLSSSASFGLGMLVGRDLGQGSAFSAALAEQPASAAVGAAAAAAAPKQTPASQAVVVSKNGSKYYFVGCSGANRISAANKVTYASAALAEAKGYTLAANCNAP